MADEWLTIPIAAVPEHLIPRNEKRGRPRKDDFVRRIYTLPEVREMLAVIPADDRDLWLIVGLILGRTFKCSDDAWELYNEWANKWEGSKDRNHDKHMRHFFYTKSQESADRELSLGTIVQLAKDNGWTPKTGDVPIEHFIYSAPDNKFIYQETMQHWVDEAVDAAVSPVNIKGKIIQASDWLRAERRVTSLANDADFEEGFIPGMNCADGVILPGVGAAVFNMYRRPTIELGDAQLAGPFVEHCQRLFNKPGDCEQVLDYLAHRRQKPGEKPRFALLIGGAQGLGKDTVVEMSAPSIGVWNVANIAPAALVSTFNTYTAYTLIRISETANAQEVSRFAFNEAVKVLIAGSPDFAIVNPKYGKQYTVRLRCGVIITTNHLMSGLFIPEDDRRYDVIECATREEMGLADDVTRRTYFERLWGWFYQEDGAQHIAALLQARDLTHFNPALGQRKTAAHAEVVRCGMISDEWARDIVDALGYPNVLRTDWILDRAVGMGEKKEIARARIGHALNRMGYEVLSNPNYKDGRWKVQGVLCKVYKRRDYKPKPEPDWQKVLEIPNPGGS